MAFEVDPVEDLSAAVDWFVEAVGPRSRRQVRRVSDPAARARDRAELERRIVPLGLPPELRWFWDVGPVWVRCPPDAEPPRSGQRPGLLVDPVLGGAGGVPPGLLPIGYTSHAYLLIDLSGPSGTPATVWLYDFDQHLLGEAPSLAALIRAGAERIESALLDQPAAEPAEVDWNSYYMDLFDGPDLRAILDRHFAASQVERQTLSPFAPETWPDRWREAQGSITGGSQPQGRTHTVAEFLGDAGRPRVRLRGVLTQMGGLEGGHERLMRLEDETGQIDLAVPPSALAPGGELGVAEVVGRGPLPPRPKRRLDPRKVQEMEERYGNWVAYLVSDEGLHGPELQASLHEHLSELAATSAAASR